MINVNQIAIFQPDALEGTNVKSTVDVNTNGTFCVYCDESYDEIKRKIEEAQG
jgi:hypothetical protein